MKKYIVKNCPVYYQKNCRTAKVNEQYCQDCTDCLMKRIVDYCKHYTNNLYCCNEISSVADDILDFLQIEEVE